MDVFHVTLPRAEQVPVILSSPHSGTQFPPEVAGQFVPRFLSNPDDTDWFIDKLYDFAPSMGITMLTANLSRWVIDLNRDPDSRPLYTDGRVITGLVPETTFNGKPLYQSAPDQAEIQRRKENYYYPYHHQLEELINNTREKFGKVLLFDAHSIRRHVPGIRKEPFPDVILGDADGVSAAPEIIESASRALGSGEYAFSHNLPFKGGYITRQYGNPENNIHAIQLEMAKDNYMDDTETRYDAGRAGRMQEFLRKLFGELIKTLSN